MHGVHILGVGVEGAGSMGMCVLVVDHQLYEQCVCQVAAELQSQGKEQRQPGNAARHDWANARCPCLCRREWHSSICVQWSPAPSLFSLGTGRGLCRGWRCIWLGSFAHHRRCRCLGVILLVKWGLEEEVVWRQGRALPVCFCIRGCCAARLDCLHLETWLVLQEHAVYIGGGAVS